MVLSAGTSSWEMQASGERSASGWGRVVVLPALVSEFLFWGL